MLIFSLPASSPGCEVFSPAWGNISSPLETHITMKEMTYRAFPCDSSPPFCHLFSWQGRALINEGVCATIYTLCLCSNLLSHPITCTQHRYILKGSGSQPGGSSTLPRPPQDDLKSFKTRQNKHSNKPKQQKSNSHPQLFFEEPEFLQSRKKLVMRYTHSKSVISKSVL